MAYNGSGVFTRLYSWVTDRNNGVKILASRMDAEMDGFATGLTNAITRDGQTTITQNIPFNTKLITGLGNAASDADALNRITGDGRFARRQAVTDKSANYTALADDIGKPLRFTAAATLTLTAAATLGSRWHMTVIADGGAVTIDPDGSETINGVTTLVLPDGLMTTIICDGTRFHALDVDGTVDAALVQARADVASATTTDIGAATTQYVRITGTTTITGLGTADAGVVRDVVFGGALTLTHNATSLILPGSANIVTVAGDTALFRSEGSGNWRCMRYEPVSGSGLGTTLVAAGAAYTATTTGISSRANEVVIVVNAVSSTGTAVPELRLGTSSGLVTSTYEGTTSNASSAASALSFSTGIPLNTAWAATIVESGVIRLTRISGNNWVVDGVLGRSDSNQTVTIGGRVVLAAALDRIGFVTSDSFDGGNYTLYYR